MSLVDHEYKDYSDFLNMKPAIENGSNVNSLIEAYKIPSERSAIEYQRSKPYYKYTSPIQKQLDNKYYETNN